MRIALEAAQDAAARGETPVGAVVVDPATGEVVAVGPGRRDDSGFLIPIDVTPGSTVLFARYGGQPYDYQGVEYRLVVENEILGVVG